MGKRYLLTYLRIMLCVVLCLCFTGVAQAAGGNAGTCTVGASTFAQCFPDINFARAVADAAPWRKISDHNYRRPQVSEVITQHDVDSITTVDPPLATDSGLQGGQQDSAKVKSIEGVQILQNLTELYLYETDVSDLSPIANLTKIEELALFETKVTDISALKNLTNLKELELGDLKIADLSPLSNLRKLERVDAFRVHLDNKAMNIAPFAHLTKLKWLDLRGNGITDISALKELTQLQWLCLSRNHISDLTPLRGMTQLWHLDLNYNDISNLVPLTGLDTKLTALALDDNDISDIEPLRNLHPLVSLELSTNNISNINPLAGLQNLQSLDISNNNASDISVLKNLTKITELFIGGNGIRDISALRGLVKIWELYIDENHISDLTPLSGLQYLRNFGADHNEIIDLSPLQSLSGQLNTVGDANAQTKQLPELSVKYGQRVSMPAAKGLHGKYLPVTSSTPTGATLDEQQGVVTWPATVSSGTFQYTFSESDKGQYQFSGTVLRKVNVTDIPTISQVERPSITTDSGTAPELPAVVNVTLSDGSRTTAPVKWQQPAKTSYSGRRGGSFTVSGTVSGHFSENVSNTVVATVTVRPAHIVTVQSQKVTTETKVAPVLPSTVSAGWSNGDTTDEHVTWDKVPASEYSQPGTFTVLGTVSGYSTKATLTVTVTEAKPIKTDSVKITTDSGVMPNLPTSVTTYYSNGTTGQSAVTWPSIQRSEYCQRSGGSFTVTGWLTSNTAVKVTATVTVRAATIARVDDVSVSTMVGNAPGLPATARVTWSNGDVTEETVTWDAIPPSRYAQTGTFTVQGSFADGSRITASVTVTAPVFSVRFDSAGGSEVAAQRVVSGERAARPSDPTKSGCRFTGWFTNDGKAYDFNTPVRSNLVLVARWSLGAVFRVSGATRYDTMAALVASGGWKQGGTVLVASGSNYPDALAASGLAGVLDAPIVLTDPGSLSNQAASALDALAPSRIIVVGGPAAVSDSVASRLRAITPRVERVSGADRADTSVGLFRHATSGWGHTAVIATGGGFADALSVSSYAYAAKAPVFLASPDGLTAGQRAALHDGGFTAVIVVGGTAAVPDAVAADAARAAGTVPSVTRLAGATRYETSVQIARWVTAHGGLGVDHAVMATGANFPDALAAGPLAGRSHAVMLLADRPDAPAFRFAASYRGSVAAATIAGGTTAVDDATARAFAQALGLPLR